MPSDAPTTRLNGHVQNGVLSPSPPVATGLKLGLASQLSPQPQSIILEMLQAVVAEYQVYGLNAAICDGVSGAMVASWRGRSMDCSWIAWMLVVSEIRVKRKANGEVGAMLSSGADLLGMASFPRLYTPVS